MFSQSLIDSLPYDDKKAATILCEHFWEKEQTNKNLIISRSLYDQYVNAINKFKIFCDPYELDYDYPLLNGNPDRDIELIRQFFTELKEKISA